MPTRRRPHCYLVITSQVPAINQLPYGVGFSGYYGGSAASVLEANRKRGVLVQAWSPLRKALSGARQAFPGYNPCLQRYLCTPPPLRRGQGGVRRHRQAVR